MSAPKRFFVQNIDEENAYIEIAGDEFLHATKVLRLKCGDEIKLICNENEYQAIISTMSKHSFVAHITQKNQSDNNPNTQIVLCVGILKGDKNELVIQKATELGVSKVVFYCSKFTNGVINSNKLERFERVAKEASKQCMRTRVPQIELFDDFEKMLISFKDYSNKLFFCEFEQTSQTSFFSISGETCLVVGSEGGFCESEYERAKELGYLGMSLGKRILKAETAAISCVTLASYFLGELG